MRVVLAAVLLAAGAGAATRAQPAAPAPAAPPAASTVPLAAAVLACPDPVVGGATTSEVTAVSAGALDGGEVRGQLALDRLQGRGRLQGDALPGGGTALLERRRGELLHALVPAGTGPVVARASGLLAPDLAAGQWTRSTSGLEPQGSATGSSRGTGLAACSSATTSTWFVGGSGGTGRTAALYLSDPDPAPAVVDVEVWGPSGPLDAPALHDVALAPGGQRVLRLDAVVPADRYAVHVVPSQGRVAAALRTSEASGLQPLGWDWVPAAEAPAERLVVPAVLPGSGTRTLRVVAPGRRSAVVAVRVVGPDGDVAPDALAAVRVRAGTVTDVDVTSAVSATPSALVVSSDVPVTASVLERQGAAPGASTRPGELAYTAAVPPLRAGEVAVVPWVPTGTGRFAELTLSATTTAARVRLTPLGRPGRPAPAASEVDVPSDRTVRVALPTAVGTYPYAVRVQVLAGSGPVSAGVTLREAGADGPLLAALPLRAVASSVRVPAVQEDPGLARG
ncbi:hypothetical protein EV189_1946 [Motilibacter rhizosphaerae]|uniref:Secreted protein n=1 Tax=Motilibacter rhizosphaerae TaxID=598652 RepID=A0A4Q7NSP3_9ACTN|nr:DUF5719 family protein [Motilibacter rhizosphaerae]RZS90163.1 hypothetical protein EV189_1946 [Motilibacter rhizosphaerae]